MKRSIQPDEILVYEQVAMLLSETAGSDVEDLSADTRLQEIEPIHLAKLAIACEQTFAITLYDDAVCDARTLGDLAAHIEHLLESGQRKMEEVTEEDRLPWFYE